MLYPQVPPKAKYFLANCFLEAIYKSQCHDHHRHADGSCGYRQSDDETRKRVEEITIKAYNALGMSGFSRSEFIIMDGIPYMLEMNTNPGFSPASILPQQAAFYGISIKDLCGNEVEKALAKK